VRDGSVLAEGWTQAYGSDHAEVNALKKLGGKAPGAEMYVTLEPCAHHGKTPPCTKAIMESGIRRVYVGILDPNPLVAGKGIRELEAAGIEVYRGFCQEEISRQLEYYLVYITQQRPFVLWKTALSLDGKFRAEDGSSRWISNEQAQRYVHKLRSEADVILTGINTVINDDPRLNVRWGFKGRNSYPVRAILDPSLLIPFDSKIVQTIPQQITYIFHASDCRESDRIDKLRAWGAKLFELPCDGEELDLVAVLNVLHQQKHYLVMLECGESLSSSFWAKRLIDKCIFIYGNKLISGTQTIMSSVELPNIGDAIIIDGIKVRKLHSNIMVSGYPHY